MLSLTDQKGLLIEATRSALLRVVFARIPSTKQHLTKRGSKKADFMTRRSPYLSVYFIPEIFSRHLTENVANFFLDLRIHMLNTSLKIMLKEYYKFIHIYLYNKKI